MSNQIKAWQALPVTADVDAEIDHCDHEPSLKPLSRVNQQGWKNGGGDDREGMAAPTMAKATNCCTAPKGELEDREPSLG